MRALVFDNDLSYRTDYPVPIPAEDEALIRVTAVGICNTDLEITKGYMGFNGVPGHEFVGIVEECKKKDLEGTRVVGEINIGCGRCRYCRNSMRNHCTNRSVLGILNKDGAFAEYITLPVRNLHILPDSIPDEKAVFVEPLAAAFEITEQVDIKDSDMVCILGDGKLALLAAQVLALTGCKLIVFGKHKNKLSVLKNLGIETGIDLSPDERRFDIVIDCTGSLSGIVSALNIVRPRGTLIIKTTTAGRSKIDLNSVVINEITITGSRCGPFEPAIKSIESKTVDLTSLISDSFPLKDGIEAFKYASKPGVLKIILTPN